ncbi:MAG: ABC transporter substrate-binding protein [Cyclobacteriaceae bacterium]|nr:ABC transporter substrate-binding protein [Cyclobacteriaceae bacterium]
MKYHFFDFTIFLSIALWLGVFLFSACNSRSSLNMQHEAESAVQPHSNNEYAIGFDLIQHSSYKILHLFRHYNQTSDTTSYVLWHQGAAVPEQFSAYKSIEIPVQRIALLHTSYLPFFQQCAATDQIKAISEGQYVYDTLMYEQIKSGSLPEIGYGESLDTERLLELGIELVITVGFPNTPNKSQQILEELGVPVLVFSDWQEPTLLGRAEWVKLVAALTGEEALAAAAFEKTKNEYQQLQSLTGTISQKPSVICNLPYKGSWYVPGGNSYVSNVLHDAGADYLWAADPGTGGLQIDYEVAYAKGLEADYWINTDFVDRIEDITGRDERLGDFMPLKNGRVFNNNHRVARGIANDYWESGLVKPQIILADLIKIFHPELLPDHTLYYYKKVE